MYNETYDDYIRSILGYPARNQFEQYNQEMPEYQSYQEYRNPTFNTNINISGNNVELENSYPEIYKIVYPMVTKKCENVRSETFSKSDIENMTDEIYYALEEKQEKTLERIKGIILLSLVDIPLALQVYLKDDFPVMVTYAKNMKKEKMENQLMPEKSFIHPISVKTFLRYAIENKDIDFAKFSDKNYDYKEINNIKVPLFMRWGNDRELIIQKADELCKMLKEKIKNDKLDIGYIEGANHSYTGKEEILANEIQNFLREIVE